MSPWFQILLENEKKIKRKYFEDNSNLFKQPSNHFRRTFERSSNEPRKDKETVDNSLSLFRIKNI